MLKKISIITPCYNGSDFIDRWAASIMSQDYPNLQLIVVNDGSIDDSKEKLESYLPQFKNHGIEAVYLEQEHKGQASAVNKALKHVLGEYLILLDADDTFLNNAMYMQSNLLSTHPNVDIVQSGVFFIHNKYKYMRNYQQFSDPYKSIIKGNLTLHAGSCMLRYKVLADYYQGQDIYLSLGGQNLQIVLPVLQYNNKFVVQSYPFLNCYVRADSHSRGGSYENQLKRIEQWKDIYMHMITSLAESEIQMYTEILNKRFAHMQLNLALEYKNESDIKKYYALVPKEKKNLINKTIGFVRRKRFSNSKITIDPNESCSGCHACASACPSSCVDMVTDNEGFDYPQPNKAGCNNCNLCKEICPFKQKPLYGRVVPGAYAAKITDEAMRNVASSGGIFGFMARQIIENGGVVFGARLNDRHEVVHDYTETIEELFPFYGSKYVKSKIGDCLTQAKIFLEQDRQVLFSGTPCQIEGLCAFLGRDYENLYTVDFICHGVPSPKVWAAYVSQFKKPIGHISFRDKTEGWKKFSLFLGEKGVLSPDGKSSPKKTIYRKNLHKDLYLTGFLRNYYLRPSCYNCQTKKITRISDVTLADFWGIEHIDPYIDDDKGLSLLMISTFKGERLMQADGIWRRPVDLFEAIKYNTCMHTSVIRPFQRDAFFADFNKMSIRKLMKKYCGPPNKIKTFVGRVFRFGIKTLRRLERD